ncbi:hypothetical protein Tco_0370751 [Tanacetum coccineum]
MPEITLPPRKRLGIDLGPRYEIRESSAAATTRLIGGHRANYGFVDPREAVEEVALMTLRGVNARVTELTIVQEQDTQDIYAVIEDTQDRQIQIYQSVETLFDDSQYHHETARLYIDQAGSGFREHGDAPRGLHAQMAKLQRQLGPAKGLVQPDAPGEAGSSS